MPDLSKQIQFIKRFVMKTLKNLDLKVPRMSTGEAQLVFGGGYLGDYYVDDYGNFWLGGNLVWDDHAHDEAGYWDYNNPNNGTNSSNPIINTGFGGGTYESGGYSGL